MDNSSLDAYLDGSTYNRETVKFYDVAHEGAQIRAVAGAIPALQGIYGLAPRSVVVIASDHVADASARFVSRMRSPLRVPLVITDALPSYVGALDMVVILGDRADAPDISQAMINADRRGATTILVGPPRGPILEDAPDDTIVIPALPTVYGASPARSIMALSTVLDLLEENPDIVAQRLADTATCVDDELEQLSPERDSVVNPGRQLREYADLARVVHTGRGRPGFAIAELMAVIWSLKGIPSGAAALEEIELPPPAPEHDIFHDPLLDGPADLLALKAVVWAEEPEVAATLPNALAANCDTPGTGPLAAALKLITRGLAATAYDLPEAPSED